MEVNGYGLPYLLRGGLILGYIKGTINHGYGQEIIVIL